MEYRYVEEARWVQLQLGDGNFQGRRIVSPENLAATRTPKVATTDKVFYALGWITQQTPKGNIIWHSGKSHRAESRATSPSCRRYQEALLGARFGPRLWRTTCYTSIALLR